MSRFVAIYDPTWRPNAAPTFPDAGSEFEFEVRAVDAFVRWLLPLGKQVEVLSPASIKKQLNDARAALRTVYATPHATRRT